MTNIEKINRLYSLMDEIDTLNRVLGKLYFDNECICPKNGIDQENEDIAYLSAYPFRITHSEEYISLIKELKEDNKGLNEYQIQLVNILYKSYLKNKNITEEFNSKYLLESGNSHKYWLEAKEKSDYSIFKPYLEKMINLTKEEISFRDEKKKTIYDTILNDYEEGQTIENLDKFFLELSSTIVPLIKKIKESNVQIRNDFMSRSVPIYKQEAFSKWVLLHEGHNLDTLVLMPTEHPFTMYSSLGDERVTTHYYENAFISNIFSTLHEGGHALFDQNEPKVFKDNHINQNMTMSMHECMSRLFENMVGRSEAYIDLIYPYIQTNLGDTFKDVTKEELYKAINESNPSLIRIEADELTYPLHILIRYELEKGFINGEYGVEDLDKRWNELYKKYLGVEVTSDSKGILQDVHWTSTYGYFPSYALGSAYAAQIVHRMKLDLDFDQAIREDRIIDIVNWLKDHAFNLASINNPKDWIIKVTGEEFNPKYYLDYLKDKYSKIYNIKWGE